MTVRNLLPHRLRCLKSYRLPKSLSVQPLLLQSESHNNIPANILSDVSSRPQIPSEEIFCYGSYEKTKRILDLSASVDGIKATITKDIYTGNYFIEICEESVSKASAILKLKEMYDIDEIVAFGDNVNDVEMLELSDRCYVPENGLPQIREMADMVIEKNDLDSVARFIVEDYYK